MTLPEAVVVLNREIERTAIERDFCTLEKLSFIKQQIIQHSCTKRKN